ncbi:hypothetical protein SAMN04487949_3528 [Halogranum gelatinilyticum]|uniref:DUF8030 domain-containing protein n=2 Tax=Halogranum gelatinilyticum TaxID=660521 RepID=A0A1G9Z3B0_9EURY|nr:hypothetical protein SAMN04487949_3528 [Halogranum gelatinilyticum]
MNTEQQHKRNRRTNHEPACPDIPHPVWTTLSMQVPNSRSRVSIVSFVECVLVELTHESLGAEYLSSNVWGVKRTQFIADDDVGETFLKRHYDERLGWHKTMMSREEVRSELVDRLTRTTSLSGERNRGEADDEFDRFSVKLVGQLWSA